MKKILIKMGDKLMIPLFILAGGYFLFNEKIQGLAILLPIRYILLTMGVIVFISGVLQMVNKLKK